MFKNRSISRGRYIYKLGDGTFVDYQWATEPTNLKIRKKRILEFLKIYNDDSWEDSVHIRYVRYAKYKLLQCHYNLGELKKSDKIIQELIETDTL